MPVPFGVGVGDFIAVGKLIGKIVIELQENGEAAPEYQSLLLELEALGRALHQLQQLEPTHHELLQLRAIRATALTCQRPLEEFLTKISKFEATLGTFNAKNNRFKGFPRRMQWRTMFKEDVKHLRSVLGSHVGTINLLLMTQTVGSLTAADRDRERVACGLESKILAHRRQLDSLHTLVEHSIDRHLEAKLRLEDQSMALSSLESKADRTKSQLDDQKVIIQNVQTSLSTTQIHTSSILSTTIDILTVATSGFISLQTLAQQLVGMFQLLVTFTTEMRIGIANLTQLFSKIHAALCRIEMVIPNRISLPIVQFTDALGDTMALPYQLCQQWSTFKELLGVIFIDKPGKARVESGQYAIMKARGGMLLREAYWHHAVKEDDHLSMSIIIDGLDARDGYCPFPSCGVSIDGAELTNGGRTCPVCYRWALPSPRKNSDTMDMATLLQEAAHEDSGDDWETDSESNYMESRDDLGRTNTLGTSAEEEDIEVYRQIHVLTSTPGPTLEDPLIWQQPLTDVDLENLTHAYRYLRYGFMDDRADEIVRDAGLEGYNRDLLPEPWDEVRRQRRRRLSIEAVVRIVGTYFLDVTGSRKPIPFDHRGIKSLDAVNTSERSEDIFDILPKLSYKDLLLFKKAVLKDAARRFFRLPPSLYPGRR